MKHLNKSLSLLLAVFMALMCFAAFAEIRPLDDELDAALNVEGGTLTFVNDIVNPMTVDDTQEGRICAKSGNYNINNSTSKVSVTFTAEAGSMFCYDVKTSTEPTYDKFILAVNGNIVSSHTLSGINDWATKTYAIESSGEYTVELRYTKDSSVNRNEDTVWIDNIHVVLPTPVTGLEIPENLTVSIGHPETIVPVFTPEDATITDLSWASSDEEVATVSDGIVTAVAPGECDITATTVNNIEAVCHVTVPNPIEPTGITLNFSEGTLPTGFYTTNIIATVLPADAYDTGVTWSCEPEGLVTVSGGRVTAASGLTESADCVLTATTVNGLSASITLHVLCLDDVPGIDDMEYTPILVDTEYTGTIIWGESQQIRFPRANPTTSYWSTSNCAAFSIELTEGVTYDFLSYAPDGVTRYDTYLNVIAPDGSYLVANDDGAGLGYGQQLNVVAPATGTYRIIISAFNYYTYGAYAVKVNEHHFIPVEGVTFDDDSVTIGIGGSSAPTYAILPADATNKAVSFESADTEIATVDENGVIIGVAAGTTTVTITTDDGNFSDTIDVIVINTLYIFTEDFDNNPAGRWTRTSPNSDNTWYFSSGSRAHGGAGGYAGSDSFDEDYPLTPNNYLISPSITLPDDISALTLSYYVSCDGYTGEHYTLYISTSGNSVSDFTEVLISETLSNTVYEERTVDLSAYAGQTIYLAWRHHECTDVMSLLLDTISIIGFPAAEPIPGDVNNDGILTSDDALLILRHTLGLTELDESVLALADINGDGDVDISDALLTLRMVIQ